MNKPLFTDRTKLYIGGLIWCDRGAITLAPCIDNANGLIKDFNYRMFIAPNNGIIERPSSVTNLIEGPLTLVELADEIRATKVDSYTHLLLADCTFMWAKHTPEGFVVTNGRTFDPQTQPHYLNAELEWFADWRKALPKLMTRLNKRLQEVRAYGKTKRLEYTAYIDSQTAIDKAQSIEIRANNKRFKGITY